MGVESQLTEKERPLDKGEIQYHIIQKVRSKKCLLPRRNTVTFLLRLLKVSDTAVTVCNKPRI